ncbi:hypothetical protein O181_022250 [Austropuccinia psidii MF-1]|uniref:Reverse transcriptase Ty1/copia-type domain-containing protein n=1 Tax=Austropuccinia psidii MF-1 TaxID=1389203 RepID=A0A9Q3CH26_9BASI|nr:hypothetical protein [Austropuccinia psidii MF-1]
MDSEHHQNGKIERENRLTLEIDKTSLLAANSKSELWPFAFKHAELIYNCNFHSNINQTPDKIVSKRKSCLLTLRTFGHKFYIHDHNYWKDLSARGIVGYHLGIAPDSVGWLFCIPELRSIVKAASIKFDERSFFLDNNLSEGNVLSIQAENLFDPSMIKESEIQDQFMSTINNTHDPLSTIPTTYKEAISSYEQGQWREAIKEELDSMNQEEIFEKFSIREALKEVPHNSVLHTKWVFVKKSKAFLVARGFKQIHSINFDETFSPTATFGTLLLLFSIVYTNNWPIWTFDVKVAFLHSLIDKPVYIWPPKGMDIPKHMVLKLQKELYGTKQAARCWWLQLETILEGIGFHPNGEDQSTYCHQIDQGRAILWSHFNDGVLTASTNKLMKDISHEMNEALKMKWDETISRFFGISITSSNNCYKFHQKDLISKLIDLKPSNVTTKSPLPANCDLQSNKSNEMDKEYFWCIGMLLYIAQGS